jgi:hypothetical protein
MEFTKRVICVIIAIEVKYVLLLEPQQGASGMFQYFVKIVPTIYENLNGQILNTNQFSVTEHYKPVGEMGHGLPGK